MFKDGQDVAVEQPELKLERESARPPNFLEPVEGAASLSNSGDECSNLPATLMCTLIIKCLRS